MTVHPTARHHHHTVIKRLEAMRPGEFLTLIHRLDRETSGALMVGRSREADRAFKRVLEDRSVSTSSSLSGKRRQSPRGPAVEKVYLAITRGVPATPEIAAPLEPDSDNPLRVKMRVAAPGHGLNALTGIEVLGERAGYALVRCTLFTGRQHQIRVHLAHLGCPIVGDKLYGPDERLLARAADDCLTDEDRELLEIPRHALHAHRYGLVHPLTGAELRLESPLPADLSQFWDSLKGR
jgi:23S rRNA pseudouridine1911/1915/1917 synthase